jgi:hypothetical protein
MKKNMVKIELAGQERHLYYNLNSLEIIEDLTGSTLDKVTKNISMKTLKALVYAGLVHEDKDLTVEAVGEMIGFEDIQVVSEAIGQAFGGLQ